MKTKYQTLKSLFDQGFTKSQIRSNDLRGADLMFTDLRGANLSGADLIRTNLRGATLEEADLSGANLSGANLICADLRGADLSGANLICADLSDADLIRTNLRGATLEGAILDFSCLSLWCGSLAMKTDEKQRIQICFHFLSLIKHSENSTEKEKEIYNSLLDYANDFHRIPEIDKLKRL